MNRAERRLLQRARQRLAFKSGTDAGKYLIMASKNGITKGCLVASEARIRLGVQTAISELIGASSDSVQPPDDFITSLKEKILLAKQLHGAGGCVQIEVPINGVELGIIWEEEGIADTLKVLFENNIEHRLAYLPS